MCLLQVDQYFQSESFRQNPNLSIIREDNNSAVGLAKPFPVVHGIVYHQGVGGERY